MNPYSILKGGFMPNCVMESDISHAAKVCYLALASFAGKDKDTCWPSQGTLAAKYNSNERSTREHLDELQKAGFIRVTQNGLRKSNTYEFFSLEDYDSGVAENRRSGTAESAGQGTAENRRSGTAENRRSFPISEPLSYEPLSNTDTARTATSSSLLSDQNLQNHPEASLEPEALQDSNPERPPATDSKYFESQSTSYELQLGESVDYFVQWMYKRKGKDIDATGKFIRGKLTSRANTPLREKLESFERKHGVEEFRTALYIYFETERPALETAHWPLNFFLHDILDYLPDAHSLPCRAPHNELEATARPSDASARSETPPAARTSEKSLPVYLQYVDRWNTLVPEATCGELPGFVVRQVEKAIQDPEFAAVFEEIAEKCGQIARAGLMGVTFRWLCTSTQAGPTWQQVYMGKFDWALRSRSTGQMSASDQALEEAARREREAEAEERGK